MKPKLWWIVAFILVVLLLIYGEAVSGRPFTAHFSP